MSSLAKLKAKYDLSDGAKYEPNPNCKRCGGVGERKTLLGDVTFCHCLFIEPDFSNEIGDMLSDFARKMREEMNG